jgi:hypothetical protein
MFGLPDRAGNVSNTEDFPTALPWRYGIAFGRIRVCALCSALAGGRSWCRCSGLARGSGLGRASAVPVVAAVWHQASSAIADDPEPGDDFVSSLAV